MRSDIVLLSCRILSARQAFSSLASSRPWSRTSVPGDARAVDYRWRCCQVGLLLAGAVAAGGCAVASAGPAGKGTSYQEDVAFLRKHTPVIELRAGNGRVAVTPAFQGRVMTCGVSPDGPSLGWINRTLIPGGDQDIPFNSYGGQDRFWLGPEGGQYTIYFKKDVPQNYDTWRVPKDLNMGPFVVDAQDASSVRMHRSVRVTNAAGTTFDVDVHRTIRVIDRTEAQRLLNITIPANVAYVGSVSENRITNVGDAPWKPETGTVNIWTLGMFAGRKEAVVIAPYNKAGTGPEANTAYFANQPSDRIVVDRQAGVVLMRGDGACMTKFGLSASRATDRMASINFATGVLTVAHFDRTPNATQYGNCVMMPHQDDPYGGDAIQSYNHHGKTLAPFYELESCSPAAFLAPGRYLAHNHRVLQFQGPLEALSKLTQQLLGISLDQVRRQMPM